MFRDGKDVFKRTPFCCATNVNNLHTSASHGELEVAAVVVLVDPDAAVAVGAGVAEGAKSPPAGGRFNCLIEIVNLHFN